MWFLMIITCSSFEFDSITINEPLNVSFIFSISYQQLFELILLKKIKKGQIYIQIITKNIDVKILLKLIKCFKFGFCFIYFSEELTE